MSGDRGASPTLVILGGGPNEGQEQAIDDETVEACVDMADGSRHLTERVPNRRTAGRVLARALLVGVAAVFVVFFRPQALGGRVSYGTALTSSMVPTIPKGDLVAAEKQSRYQSGNIIVYRLPGSGPGSGKVIIGRIVGGNGVTGFAIKGDSAPGRYRFHPTNADVVGKMWFHLRGALLWSFAVAFAMIFVIAAWPGKRKRPGSIVPRPDPERGG